MTYSIAAYPQTLELLFAFILCISPDVISLEKTSLHSSVSKRSILHEIITFVCLWPITCKHLVLSAISHLLNCNTTKDVEASRKEEYERVGGCNCCSSLCFC